MKYALLIYGSRAVAEADPERDRALDPRIAAVLERPSIAGWTRLHDADSATTLRREQARTLLTDGPFVDSKEYLAGLIVVAADDLDAALAIAEELQELRPETTIEVRPVLESA